jgi:hypothetical protein
MIFFFKESMMPARSGCLSILWKSKLAIDFKRWTHSFELMYSRPHRKWSSRLCVMTDVLEKQKKLNNVSSVHGRKQQSGG